jgi:NAD(P)-dependent dehydrogenase (short-subunit alcohol dehydrogenase family)
VLQESLSLEGPPRRVAIVTGGSRGLGKEMARSLALAGADVCIASRTASELDKTRTELEEVCGREVLAIPTDVKSREQCDALIGQTVERFGRLDIMLNNAGLGDRRGAGAKLWELEDEPWHDPIEVNLYSTFYCSRAAARQFRAQGEGGVILNVASGSALRSQPRDFGYGAAKAGVISLTKSTAAMLIDDGVRANCIVPGFVLQQPPATDEEREAARQRGRFNPTGRLGDAWELGPLAVFLCSDAAHYITSEVFVIDGGGLAGGIAPAGWAPETGGGHG